MRRALTLIMALTLTSLVVGSPLVVCPFLQAKPPACCRKTSSHPPRCPFAPSLERCPFYLTESKIGETERKAPIADALIVPALITYARAVWVPFADMGTPHVADGAGRYLRLRVLRL